MKEEQLIQWIESQKSIIDNIIYQAGNNFFNQNKSKDNFAFELAECQNESFNLIGNRDLCYDRYCTPFVYSLWYQARRVNTFLHFFAKAILSSNDRHIEIFDLGAGTGAIQFAVGLVYLGMKEIGLQPPKTRIINIDTSPLMLSYNKEYIWKAFVKEYPIMDRNEEFTIEYNVNSWSVPLKNEVFNPWLTASYLFDASDNQEYIAKAFADLIQKYKPTTILLLTSKPKKKLMDNVVSEIKQQNNYFSDDINETSLLFRGNLEKVNRLRTYLSQNYQGRGLSSLSSWDDNSFVGTILRTTSQAFNLVTETHLTNINLFNPKIKVRKDIELSKEQKEASNFLGRPSIVIGPAGSGKSVVISEKIKYIVEQQAYNSKLKILVTSFNKGLIWKLGKWTEQLLDDNKFTKKKISDDASQFKFSSHSTEPNISLLHFDLLPTRLGNIKGTCYGDQHHIGIMQSCVEQVKKEKDITDSKYDAILDPEFLYEEYHRIFYGMNIKTKDGYLTIKRSGMWKALKRDRREIVYDCILKYMHYLHKNKIHSFFTRRRQLLNQLKNGVLNIKYDYVFVDEFQDCTLADFEIFIHLIKDVNNLTFAGDLAQAIHIGKAADVPKRKKMAEFGYNIKNFKHYMLDGSYRLPQRISESIIKLSEEIVIRWMNHHGASAISPVKSSPPGSRPIVVFSETVKSMASKVKSIFETYNIYSLSKVSILERDRELCKELSNLGVLCETDTILSLKGLEKDCILWSTRIDIKDEKEVYEFVYTILTRTSSILIIALSNATQHNYKKVINLLDRDKLIFWDEETREKYNDFCEYVELEIQEDEEIEE